jgi:phage gpG-like protein
MINFSAVFQDAVRNSAREQGATLSYSIQQNFKALGRPTKWKKAKRGGATLQQTGRLRNSINVRAVMNRPGYSELIASTNLAYAPIHHYGGVITPKKAKSLAIPLSKEAMTKRPRDFEDKRLFVMTSKKGTKFLAEKVGETTIRHFVLVKSVKIPERPFMMIQTEDIETFEKILVNHISDGLRRR